VSDQGTTFAAFVKDQLEAERKRRDALDQRGSETVKATGTLVTLVVGFAAILLGTDYRPQSRAALIFLSVALLLLLVSIGFALTTTQLLRYAVTSKKGLDEILNKRWESTEPAARSTVAKLSAETIDTLRTGNNTKASRLYAALWLQLVGLALLVGTVIAEVASRVF
jgi:hypothetical protein